MGKGGSSGASTQTTEIPEQLKPLYHDTGERTLRAQGENPIDQYIGARPAKIAPLAQTQTRSINLVNENLDDALGPLTEAEIFRGRGATGPNMLEGTSGPLDNSEIFAAHKRMGNLEDSEIAQAGGRYFNKSIAPGITNEATLSGLGRSTANTNARAAAEAETMLPLIQAEQARRDSILRGEQGRRDTLRGSERDRLDTLLRSEQGRQDAMIGQGLQAGDIERGVEQQGYNAEMQDFLRRQGLSEQALFGPLGQLPSTFGQSGTTKTSGGGGMFK